MFFPLKIITESTSLGIIKMTNFHVHSVNVFLYNVDRMKIFDIETVKEDIRFYVSLQAHLRLTALKISESENKTERFAPYINAREQKLRELLHCVEEFQIYEKGKCIFP